MASEDSTAADQSLGGLFAGFLDEAAALKLRVMVHGGSLRHQPSLSAKDGLPDAPKREQIRRAIATMPIVEEAVFAEDVVGWDRPDLESELFDRCDCVIVLIEPAEQSTSPAIEVIYHLNQRDAREKLHIFVPPHMRGQFERQGFWAMLVQQRLRRLAVRHYTETDYTDCALVADAQIWVEDRYREMLDDLRRQHFDGESS
jgi:hypothetical protein